MQHVPLLALLSKSTRSKATAVACEQSFLGVYLDISTLLRGLPLTLVLLLKSIRLKAIATTQEQLLSGIYLANTNLNFLKGTHLNAAMTLV